MKANEKTIRLAIMCSEAKPEECHRSKLIGQEFMKQGIAVKHGVIPADCNYKGRIDGWRRSRM